MNDRKWLLVADVDGTLTVEHSIWGYLHRKLGTWESHGLPSLNAYLAGEIDYPEFSRRDTLVYKGLSRAVLNQYCEKVERRPGMERMLRRFKKRGAFIVLISSGLDIMVDQIPYADVRICNRLIFKEDICTGECEINMPIDGKRQAMKDLLLDHPYSREKIVVMGDSKGDVPMMESAGFSIAVNPLETEVEQVATTSIKQNNLIQASELVEDYLTGLEIRKPRIRR